MYIYKVEIDLSLMLAYVNCHTYVRTPAGYGDLRLLPNQHGHVGPERATTYLTQTCNLGR